MITIEVGVPRERPRKFENADFTVDAARVLRILQHANGGLLRPVAVFNSDTWTEIKVVRDGVDA